MKKPTVIASALAAVMVIGSLSVSAFAASDPADDVSGYSYNAGRQSYETRMAEGHEWFGDQDEAAAADYSFHTGSANAQSRIGAFAGMPAEDEHTDEELADFFAAHGLGGGAAYANGEYDSAAESGYGYSVGQAACRQRHASFSGN